MSIKRLILEEKKILLRILFLIFITSVAGQAFGVPIVVSIDAPTTIVKGSFFHVNINVTGLESNAYLLREFSLDLHIFNNDVISLYPDPTRFGDELGEENLEVITGEGKTDLISKRTKLELFAVSLLPDFQLANMQTDDFINLATLNFFAPFYQEKISKSATIVANNFVIRDALGNQITGHNPFDVAEITVIIPEPASIFLFSFGLIGIFSSCKQCFTNQALEAWRS